jgi:hypothetical protein
MKLIKLTFTLSLALLFGSKGLKAQLFIDNADFMIEGGAFVTVQGDVESNVDILTNGDKSGLLLLKGSALQNVNMNGFIIPNLEVDNAANANLTGGAKISETLRFTAGKVTLNTFNLRIDHDAAISGNDATKFAETNLTGELQKDILVADLASYEMPVGVGTTYNPVYLTSTGPYQPGSFVGVRDTLDKHPKLFPQATDYLKSNYWPITQTGITKLDAKGNYIDPLQVQGTDLKFTGFFWQDVQQAWSLTGTNVDQGANLAGVTITGNGDLYAMNIYGLVNAKLFLQGAYDANVHLMRDNLRKGGNGNLIPQSDPYRVLPYSTAFTHVNNPVVEIANASIFSDQGLIDNDIVDWVFLELRSGVDGKTKLATRSALVQRDGDVVDVDGFSPVYFKDVPIANNYTLAARHRNHLGMSTDPVTNPVTVDLATPPLVDFTTLTDAQIFGPAGAYKIAADDKNNLWGGNGNLNPLVSYNGAANDKNFLLINTLNNNANLVIVNTYNAADYNMNRIVSFNGASNDKNFLLINVLNNNDLAVKIQSLP